MKKFILMFAVAAAGCSISSRAQLALQDFEGTTGTALPTGWTQSTPTGSGWKTGTNTTFDVGNWPSLGGIPAHTRVVGVVDASASSVNPADTLISPSFSLVGITSPYLSFDGFYGQLGLQSGQFESALILVSNNNGPWVLIDSVAGTGTSAFWQTQHVNMSAYASDNNVRVAFTYTDRGGYITGLCLDNITVAAPPANDVALLDVSPLSNDPITAYGPTGGTLPLTGDIENMGATTITSFNINYQVGTNAVVTVPVTGVNVATYATYSFNAGNITLPATAGNYNVNVWTSLTGDSNPLNDSATTIIGAYDNSHMPTKRLAIEEATGTWCGWCVRGIVYMDSLEELYGTDVSLVAVHNSDPMTVTAYDAYETSFKGFTGFPNALVDRRELVDPGDLLDVYANENAIYGFADISIGTRALTGTSLSVPVTITPAFPLNGDYRVVMSVTEDQVYHPGAVATSTWQQHNYYSYIDAPTYGGGPLSGQGIDYVDSSTTLDYVHFNHVARGVSPSVTGTDNLPTTMVAGTAYPVTLTTTLNSAWVLANLKVVVMLLRGSDGVVLNSNNVTLWPTSVANVTANISKAAVFPNPASSLTNVALELSANSTVQVKVTDMIGREVYATPSEQYNSGKHMITIPTGNLASGVYNVSVYTENGSVTQRLSVVN